MTGAGGRRTHRFLCGASRAYRDGCGGAAAAAAVEFFHAAADLTLRRRRRRYVVQRQCTASYWCWRTQMGAWTSRTPPLLVIWVPPYAGAPLYVTLDGRHPYRLISRAPLSAAAANSAPLIAPTTTHAHWCASEREAQIGGRFVALGCGGGGASLNGNFNSRFMSRVELSATNGRFDVKRKHWCATGCLRFQMPGQNCLSIFPSHIVSNYLLVEAEEWSISC